MAINKRNFEKHARAALEILTKIETDSGNISKNRSQYAFTYKEAKILQEVVRGGLSAFIMWVEVEQRYKILEEMYQSNMRDHIEFVEVAESLKVMELYDQHRKS